MDMDASPQAAQAMERARRIEDLAGHARATVWGTVLTLIMVFGRSFVPLPNFVPPAGQERIPGFVADLAIYLGVSIVTLIVILGNFLLVAVWTLRARRNLDLIGARDLTWTPAWAAGGWLIPFANLAVPFLVLQEVWKASNPRALLPHGWSLTKAPKRLAVWWGFWVAGSLLFVVTELGVLLASLVARVPVMLQIEVRQVAHLLLIVAGGLWIHVVKRVTANQLKQAERVAPAYEVVPERRPRRR